MGKRPACGRGLFYTRDSGGEHETTPGEYVLWAAREAARLGVSFQGTPSLVERLIREGRPHEGDVFIDYGVQGNQLERPGLGALMRASREDPAVSHIFVPRRDRLARPEEAIDGMRLEDDLRRAGLALVFMDRELPALRKGGRRDLGELIVAMVDYSNAGEFRRELAQKMIYAQLALAKAGYSGGGRPPYGFRRWLAGDDGTRVRQLADGERVRMPGHHVVWLPGPEAELAVIRRILGMLDAGMPATRVAAALTAEGLPSPDAGRIRTDKGVRHSTSGVWHQTTIVNIARNPLVSAVVSYGRRSMGDTLRFTPDGPRPLEEQDLRPDGRPKVVANPESTRVTAPARFEPLIDAEAHGRLLRKLDARGGSQRGKPRSRDPRKNPLGGRVFDMQCGWPMYREPYNGSFRYTCGLYQQSHGGRCDHNTVAGPLSARVVLEAILQNVLAASKLEALRSRLRRLAEAEHAEGARGDEASVMRARMDQLDRDAERVARNMALADDEDQYRAVSRVYKDLRDQREALSAELGRLEANGLRQDTEAEVEAAMALLDDLGILADDPENLEAIGELFRRLDVRLFLQFRAKPWGKRMVHRVGGGVVTFGEVTPPVSIYEGPTSRPRLRALTPPPGGGGISQEFKKSSNLGQEGDSSGNLNRGGGI